MAGSRMCRSCCRINPKPSSAHPSLQVWEDGQALKDVRARLAALAEQRDAIEAARKSNKKRLPLPGQVRIWQSLR